MRNLAEGYIWTALAAVCAVALLSGCDGGGDSSSAPVGPDIAGAWSGYFENEETGQEVSITADVYQDGSGVTIKTSKSGLLAQSFSGTIDAEGNMSMIDAGDGELWTSFMPATANRILITDFIHHPQAGDTNDVPRNIVDLRR